MFKRDYVLSSNDWKNYTPINEGGALMNYWYITQNGLSFDGSQIKIENFYYGTPYTYSYYLRR